MTALAAFAPAERRIVHFTGFAHAVTHYAELTYPTLAVGLAAETGTPLEVALSWSFASYLLFGLGALTDGQATPKDAYYLNPGQLLDPWNRSYLYVTPGPGGQFYEVLSYGADGQAVGRPRQRRQRVEGAEDVAGAIDEVDMAALDDGGRLAVGDGADAGRLSLVRGFGFGLGRALCGAHGAGL